MVEIGRLTRWRGAVSMTAAMVVIGAVGWVAARPATAQAPFDIDQARAELADYIAANPPLPAGSNVPADGPPCPLATPEQVVSAAGSLPVSVDPWYSYTAIDSQLQSDVGDRVAVVRCVAATPGPDDVGVSLFALDIDPYDEVGLDFDRVARRFGAGQPAWVELPQIGGDFVGVCRPSEPSRQACLVLWHRDGLVIGAEFTLPATISGADFDNITIDLVTSVV
ncbi:MAG TPA: hypothetical protein VFO97_05635, partial [Desertimonas sp.]|nr:hypothetical protein [Desertimonas sp.]